MKQQPKLQIGHNKLPSWWFPGCKLFINGSKCYRNYIENKYYQAIPIAKDITGFMPKLREKF